MYTGDRSHEEDEECEEPPQMRGESTPLRRRSRSPQFFRDRNTRPRLQEDLLGIAAPRPLPQLPEGWGAWQQAQPAVPEDTAGDQLTVPTSNNREQGGDGSCDMNTETAATEGDQGIFALDEPADKRLRQEQPAVPEDTEGDKLTVPTSNDRQQGGDDSCDMNTETAATESGEGPESEQRSQSWQDRRGASSKWGYNMKWLQCSFDKGTLWTYNKDKNWWQHWTLVNPEERNWHSSQASSEDAALEQGTGRIIREDNEAEAAEAIRKAPSEHQDEAMDR